MGTDQGDEQRVGYWVGLVNLLMLGFILKYMVLSTILTVELVCLRVELMDTHSTLGI